MFAQIYLTMAISTVVCKRGFSCMKRVKSDWWSKLSTQSLTRLMYLSIPVAPASSWGTSAVISVGSQKRAIRSLALPKKKRKSHQLCFA